MTITHDALNVTVQGPRILDRDPLVPVCPTSNIGPPGPSPDPGSQDIRHETSGLSLGPLLVTSGGHHRRPVQFFFTWGPHAPTGTGIW